MHAEFESGQNRFGIGVASYSYLFLWECSQFSKIMYSKSELDLLYNQNSSSYKLLLIVRTFTESS